MVHMMVKVFRVCVTCFYFYPKFLAFIRHFQRIVYCSWPDNFINFTTLLLTENMFYTLVKIRHVLCSFSKKLCDDIFSHQLNSVKILINIPTLDPKCGYDLVHIGSYCFSVL